MRVLWAAASLVIASAPMVAAASSPELYGFGPRAIALCGAIEADGNSADVSWDNPALLGRLRSVHVSVAALTLRPRHHIEQLGGGQQLPALVPSAVNLGQIAVATPLGGVFADRVGVGVLVHVQVDGPSRVLSRDPRTPQVPLYESLMDRLVIAAGVGVRPLPWLTLGLQAQLLAALVGRTDFALSSLRGEIDEQSITVDLRSRVTFALAAQIEPSPRWRVGVVWRQQSKVPYSIPLRADVEELGRLRLTVAGAGLWAPETLAWAGAFDLDTRWRLLGSMRWERWSAMPALGPQITISADDAALAAQAGRDPKLLTSMQSQPVPMAAADTVQLRGGAEWRGRRWLTLRGGLGLRPSPLPRATGTANYLDAPGVLVGLGASFAQPRPGPSQDDAWAVDIGVGWTHLWRRTALKRDVDDVVGGTSLTGEEFRLSIGVRHSL